ncbi:MAG: endonuclease III [Candidatus Aenigmatarchaeota archaeon]
MKDRTLQILDLLTKKYKICQGESRIIGANIIRDPFKTLVMGILSQNTSDRNSTKAYLSLLKRIGEISPKILEKTKESEIRRAIKPGGLYNIKAKRIKQLAKNVLKGFGGDLSILLNYEPNKLREELMKFEGVGNKTADIFLAYSKGCGVIPIDTNVARVVKRLGLVEKTANYKEMQKVLHNLIPYKKRIIAHEMFKFLGQNFCKAKNKRCEICPVKGLCFKN